MADSCIWHNGPCHNMPIQVYLWLIGTGKVLSSPLTCGINPDNEVNLPGFTDIISEIIYFSGACPLMHGRVLGDNTCQFSLLSSHHMSDTMTFILLPW